MPRAARRRSRRRTSDLQPFVAPLREQIERERDDTQHRKRGEAILKSREYSFCLYPRKHFDKLLAEPEFEL